MKISVVNRKYVVVVPVLIFVVVGVAWTIAAIRAEQPPTLDQRVYDVARQLQCPICHGESVADSPSALAGEMRALIRHQLMSGMSEQQILAYFKNRYGDSILEAPPSTGFVSFIWWGPLVMLLAGGIVLIALGKEWARRAISAAPVPTESLTPTDTDLQDTERLRQILHRELAEEEGVAFPTERETK